MSSEQTQILSISFSSIEANARIVTEERGLQDICQAMDTHMDKPQLMEAACSAIWSLSMEGKSC